MELKKSSNANNENLRLPITLMGFLFVGGLLLASFTYESSLAVDMKKAANDSATNIVYQENQVKKEPVANPEPPKFTPPPQAAITIVPPDPNPPTPIVILPPPPGPIGVPTPPPTIIAEPIDFPDVEATFPGGAAELQKWIFANVTYPETSIEMEDQGKVYLSFVVEVDGSITGVTVTKKITKELDREAARVTRKMPKWIPGEVEGRRVRTRCSLPIVFTLD